MKYMSELKIFFTDQKTSPCLGDSGGPLMWKYPSNDKFYIMGETIHQYNTQIKTNLWYNSNQEIVHVCAAILFRKSIIKNAGPILIVIVSKYE